MHECIEREAALQLEPSKAEKPQGKRFTEEDVRLARDMLRLFPWAAPGTKITRRRCGPLLVEGLVMIDNELFRGIDAGQTMTIGEIIDCCGAKMDLEVQHE